MTLQANGNQKKANVAIVISYKIDFKIQNITRHKDGHYILTKTIQQEDIIFINICAPNIRPCKYIRQLLTNLKGETSAKQ